MQVLKKLGSGAFIGFSFGFRFAVPRNLSLEFQDVGNFTRIIGYLNLEFSSTFLVTLIN